jgi:hypothetical protein
MTGLSANTLEYIVLGFSLAYTIIAFYEWRAGRHTLLGQFLGLALKIIPFLEGKLRGYRERARVRERGEVLRVVWNAEFGCWACAECGGFVPLHDFRCSRSDK